MSLTPAAAATLRRALATAVVVPVAQLGLCRADVGPPSRPLPPLIKAEIAAILRAWNLT